MSPELYRTLSVMVLAALLYWPLGSIIWVLSARRLQRQLDRPLNADEARQQRRRAYFIAVFIALAFSFLYHQSVLTP